MAPSHPSYLRERLDAVLSGGPARDIATADGATWTPTVLLDLWSSLVFAARPARDLRVDGYRGGLVCRVELKTGRTVKNQNQRNVDALNLAW